MPEHQRTSNDIGAVYTVDGKDPVAIVDVSFPLGDPAKRNMHNKRGPWRFRIGQQLKAKAVVLMLFHKRHVPGVSLGHLGVA